MKRPADRIAWLQNPRNERTGFSNDAAGRRTLKTLANGSRACFTRDAADGSRVTWRCAAASRLLAENRILTGPTRAASLADSDVVSEE